MQLCKNHLNCTAGHISMHANTSLHPQVQEKERINENNVTHLQSTVDRMLNEAKERLRNHSAERKQLVDEKTSTLNKLEAQEKELDAANQKNIELTEKLQKQVRAVCGYKSMFSVVMQLL